MSGSFRAQPEPGFRDSAVKENGPAPSRCRGHGENSNAATVRRVIHSGFVAGIRSGTVEFFSRIRATIDD